MTQRPEPNLRPQTLLPADHDAAQGPGRAGGSTSESRSERRSGQARPIHPAPPSPQGHGASPVASGPTTNGGPTNGDEGANGEAASGSLGTALIADDPRHAQTQARSEPRQPGGPGNTRVMIISDAMANRNGVGVYYADLLEHLRGRLEQVMLVCPNHGNPDLSQSYSFSLPGDASQRLHLPNIRRLSREMRRMNPHTVVVATPGPFGLLGMYLARRLGKRTVVGFHTDFERLMDLYWNRWMARASTRVMRWLQGWLFRRASVVVTTSDDMVQAAHASGAKDVRLLGTGVAKPFLDRPLSPPGPQLGRVLYAGRLAPEKNVQWVLAAAAELPEVRFTIAGDGPLRSAVEKQAAQGPGNLEYLGWVGRADMIELVDQVDMLVLPSTLESFGIVALEAMSRQRWVLVSGGCGIAQWPDLAQALYQIHEGETLAQAIRRVAALPEAQRAQTAQLAREGAVAVSEAAMQQWIDLLSEDRL